MSSHAKNRPKKAKPALSNVKVLPPANEVKTKPEASEDMPSKSRLGFWILLAIGLVILGATTYIALGHLMPGWELRIFKFINQASLPDPFTSFAKSLSNAVWGIVGLVLICFLFVPKYRYTAWQYGVAAGSAYVASFIVEHIVDRARPAMLYGDTVLRAVQDGPGFPSSHVAVLTAVCLTVWLLVKWPWRIFIVFLILAEGWSRVFLGVHAPLDAVGGIAVGMIVFAVLHLLPAKMRQFFRLM